MSGASETFACPRCGRVRQSVDSAPSLYDDITNVCSRCALLEAIWTWHRNDLPPPDVDLLSLPDAF